MFDHQTITLRCDVVCAAVVVVVVIVVVVVVVIVVVAVVVVVAFQINYIKEIKRKKKVDPN